ncbi:MAG: polysaccharide deacetylase family protein, partial [Thermomicrobiales bacterium]
MKQANSFVSGSDGTRRRGLQQTTRISRLSSFRRIWSILAMTLLVLPVLAACTGGDDEPDRTGRVVWYQGVPPGNAVGSSATSGELAQAAEPAQETQPAVVEPTATSDAAPPADTQSPEQPEITGKLLTNDELAQFQPNELGNVPVFMYHNIVQEYGPGQEGDVLFRTEAEFRADLQWLYDNDFYVIPFYDYVTNQIKAPAGKKPFVLTFDDSRPNQFNYLIGADGSVTIDPDSAVGIMEDFFASHPDFGHTAYFAMLPIWCFDYEAPDQTPYCEQKLTWLYENGYEIGNHTWDHQDLYDQPSDVFRTKVVDTSLWIEERVPEG